MRGRASKHILVLVRAMLHTSPLGSKCQVEPQKTPRERAEDLLRLLVPDWRPTSQQVLWAVRIAIVVSIILLAVLLILYLVSLLFGITVLNLLKILAVPITLGAAVPLLNWLQKKRELDVEDQRSQDEALEAYLDGMAQLLTDKERPLHQAQRGDNLSTVARARTLTVLSRLDGGRKRSVVQFLYESDLIAKDAPVLDLGGADLSGANLSRSNLIGANLSRADLSRTDLSRADLMQSDLSGTKLCKADLRNTDLSQAYLVGAQDLTDDQLSAARHARGATLPNGQKYEDWLKSKNREEDGKNRGTS